MQSTIAHDRLSAPVALTQRVDLIDGDDLEVLELGHQAHEMKPQQACQHRTVSPLLVYVPEINTFSLWITSDLAPYINASVVCERLRGDHVLGTFCYLCVQNGP
jgi:hypothetical protein